MSTLARKVAVNSGLYGIGRAVVTLGGVAATALATRYLGTARFGELSVALAFTSMAASGADFGLYTAAVRHLARAPEDEPRLLANLLGIGAVLTVAIVVVAIALMGAFYAGPHDRLVREGILILLLPLAVAAPSGTSLSLLMLRQRAAPVMVAGVISTAALLLALGSVTVLDLGFAGVAAAYALQAAANAIPPMVAAGRAVPLRPRRDPAIWRGLMVTAVPQGALLVITMIYFRLDTIILSLLSNNRQVALYGLAYRVIEGLAFVPLMLMTTLFPEIAKRDAGDQRLGEIMGNAVAVTVVLVPPICLAFGIFSDQVVQVIAGRAFEGAGVVLLLLMVGMALIYPTTVLFHSMVALGEQRLLLRMLGVVTAVNLAANVALVPVLDARGAAVALIASELVSLLLASRAVRRMAPIPRAYRPLKVGAAAAVAAGAGLGVRYGLGARLPDVAVLAIGGPVTAATFTAALWALGGIPPALDIVTGPIERRLGLSRPRRAQP